MYSTPCLCYEPHPPDSGSQKVKEEKLVIFTPTVPKSKIFTEINGDSHVLFLLTQTCAPDPGDIHATRDRRERIKGRQTVLCSAHVLKQPNQPLSPPTPHRLQSNISQGHQRATGWFGRCILDLIFILDHDFEVPRASK